MIRRHFCGTCQKEVTFVPCESHTDPHYECKKHKRLKDDNWLTEKEWSVERNKRIPK